MSGLAGRGRRPSGQPARMPGARCGCGLARGPTVAPIDHVDHAAEQPRLAAMRDRRDRQQRHLDRRSHWVERCHWAERCRPEATAPAGGGTMLRRPWTKGLTIAAAAIGLTV